MTINVHELNKNQLTAEQIAPHLVAKITKQVVLSHAVAAEIAAASLVAAQAAVVQTAVLTVATSQMVETLASGAKAAKNVASTLSEGTKVAQNSPKNVPNKRATYQMMQKSYLQAMLTEILAQLDELERTGYANWEVIGLVIGKLNAYSTQLNDGVIIPLKGLQGVDRAHSKLKTIIEKLQAKAARGEIPTEEDAKEFADAVKELKQTMQELKDNLPHDDQGNPIYPSEEYEDLVNRLEQNLDKILGRRLEDSADESIGDVLDNPAKLLSSLRAWANDTQRGPFKEWEEGSSGFATLRLELQTMVSEFSDKLNRDAQMITSLNSMAQKQIELISAMNRTFTANQISR